MLKTERKIYFNSSFTEGKEENNKKQHYYKRVLDTILELYKELYMYMYVYIYLYIIKIKFIETLWGTDKRTHFIEIYKNYAVFPRSHQLIVVRTKLRNGSFIFYLFWHLVPLQLYPHFVSIFNSKISWIIHCILCIPPLSSFLQLLLIWLPQLPFY